MIAVLDSNIWISYALNQQLDFIASLHKHHIIVASCPQLYDELEIVLKRPKFIKYFSTDFIEKFSRFYQLTTYNFEISNIEPVVTDEKDNYLFALCKVANADYFITGDKLLLNVKDYHGTSIISLTDFKKTVLSL